MKVLVFGGAGYLGSHVCDILSDSGYDVTIVDRKQSPYQREGQQFVSGDITDPKFIKQVITGFDYVFHFAGIADIKEAHDNPIDTFQVNVTSLLHILKTCAENNVKRFIYASSVYVYSNHGSFYKTSKQCAELFIETFQENYGLNFSIIRYGSLYGPRANHFNFIHNAIRQALQEGKIIRKGNGNELRDYIHIVDAAEATVNEIENEKQTEYLMLTGYQTMKVKNVLELIKEVLNNKVELVFTDDTMEGHYQITPYSFRPKVAKKVVLEHYHDLGQGILECVHEVYEELGMDKQ